MFSASFRPVKSRKDKLTFATAWSSLLKSGRTARYSEARFKEPSGGRTPQPSTSSHKAAMGARDTEPAPCWLDRTWSETPAQFHLEPILVFQSCGGLAQ